MVGAWCFLDHPGPLEFEAGHGLAVGPHPHIGLQTFTWMIEGEAEHRDSLGNAQAIRPGQVNLMSAAAAFHMPRIPWKDTPARGAAVDRPGRGAPARRAVVPQLSGHAVLPLTGAVGVDGAVCAPDAFACLAPGRDSVALRCAEPVRLILVGGEPFGEDILLWWNFVARTRDEITDATRDWNEGTRFGAVHDSPSRPRVAPDVSGLRLRETRR